MFEQKVRDRIRQSAAGDALQRARDDLASLQTVREAERRLVEKRRPWWYTAIMAFCFVVMLCMQVTASDLGTWAMSLIWLTAMSLMFTLSYFQTRRMRETMTELMRYTKDRIEFTKAQISSLEMLQEASRLMAEGNPAASMLLMQESVRLLKEHTDAALPPDLQWLVDAELPVVGGVQ